MAHSIIRTRSSYVRAVKPEATILQNETETQEEYRCQDARRMVLGHAHSDISGSAACAATARRGAGG